MRKNRHGPALFEVLTSEKEDGTEKLEVPSWWSSGGRRLQNGTPAKDKADRWSSRSEPAVEVDPEALPFVEFVGGRLRVSFTSITAAVAVFILMVALVLAYEIGGRSGEQRGIRKGYEAGRASYAADAMSEIELARSKPPATHLVASLLENPAAASESEVPVSAGSSTEDTRSTWIRDYTYIVAQEFAAESAEDAKSAQQFLAQQGIPTAIVRLSSGAVQLITTQGFNHKDPPQRQLAETLLEKEHDAGAKYFAAGGGYRLKGYFRTLKGQSWK
ncbi:MAG: hypothetical protein JSU63_18145 [Phycisphaerales bacterium]|nr:MAG: hypothetical protein JSU63_18145 [Phycisphaerales bacterium]